MRRHRSAARTAAGVDEHRHSGQVHGGVQRVGGPRAQLAQQRGLLVTRGPLRQQLHGPQRHVPGHGCVGRGVRGGLLLQRHRGMREVHAVRRLRLALHRQGGRDLPRDVGEPLHRHRRGLGGRDRGGGCLRDVFILVETMARCASHFQVPCPARDRAAEGGCHHPALPLRPAETQTLCTRQHSCQRDLWRGDPVRVHKEGQA
mmetsp:Transcript_4952/g.15533  ORF Transcript_4952/g.15533 Transcript_4952/m.15533 type:complete len:202 (-) Transcript_4952:1321-1926(-)